MGLEALTHSDGGTIVQPATDADWQEWVSATRTRNYTLGDPVLDWLELCGEQAGFERDDAHPQYDPRTNFTEFLFGQGRRFESAVVALLHDSNPIVTASTGPEDSRSLDKGRETFEAMCQGSPIIYQGVLFDAENRTYGIPDLLVRSDVLRDLFPEALTPQQVVEPAPDLPNAKWHYRVVDIKFRTLGLSANGDSDNASSAAAYKTQLFIYNRALGRLQGFGPPVSYLLGRGWTQGKERGSSSLDRLAPVPQSGTLARKRPISQAVAEAASWVRRVRTEGADWSILPEPSVPELYPNDSNTQDGPWHNAKRRIIEELEDLTMLWQVGAPGRLKGHEAGIYRWTDPAVSPSIVGVTGDKRQRTFKRILEVNRLPDGPSVQPERIQAMRGEWHETPELEFYVDFETVSDIADDFSNMPEKGGQVLIFMIGCGHLEGGQWSFSSFVVDSLTEPEEARIIDKWVVHMDSVRKRLAPNGPAPKLVHWSPAEVTNFETAYNSAKERQNRSDWPSPEWFDFLRQVMREEPVVVRGALAFGLKPVAKAMHKLGLIDTLWDDGPTDGLGAMVGAWWCQEEATRIGKPMSQIDLMIETVSYNEVDCKVMMEIVRYPRANH